MRGFLLGWDAPASRQRPGFGFTGQAEGAGEAPRLIEGEGEGHVLVCAATGTGKGRAFAIPTLLGYEGAAVVVDVKGELLRVTGRHRASLGPVLVLDPFDDVGGTGGFNPLDGLDPGELTFVDDVYSLATLFSGEVAATGKDGAFWQESAADLIAAVMAHVAAAPMHSGERTLGRVYDLLLQDDPVYGLATLMDKEKPGPFASRTLGRFLSLPDLTRGGILATAAQQIRLLAGSGVRKSLASCTLDPALIRGGGPFTIYLVFPPDRLHSHAALLRLLLTSLTQLLTSRRHRPELPTLMLVDEAAQIGRVPALVSATTLGRGYGIRVAWLFQSYGQLRSAYPQEHETILENCGTVLTLGRHPAYSMSRTLAELAFGDVSADALFGLGGDEAMLRQAGERSRVVGKLDYLNDALFLGRYDDNPLHRPVMTPVRPDQRPEAALLIPEAHLRQLRAARDLKRAGEAAEPSRGKPAE